MANRQIEKIKALANGNDEKRLILASGGLLAAGALATSMAVFLTGLAGQAPVAEPEPEPAPVVLPIVKADRTPASNLVDQLLEAPAKGWKTTGGRTDGASAPFPYSCPVSGGTPIISTSQPYTVDGKQAVLTVSVYGPGLGVKAAQQLANNARGCAAGTGSTSQWASGDRQWTASSVLSGNSVRASMAQRGDVVIHVAAPSDTKALASQVAKTLDRKLTAKICAHPDAKLSDVDRNPNSGSYRAHTVRFTAKIDDPGLPEIGEGDDIKPISLTAPLEQVNAANPAIQPSWPVWPEMPAVLDLPVAPALPEPEPVTSKKLDILAEDKEGPGCGWAFTGTSAPVFDKGKAEQANDADILAAKKELTQGAKRWSESILEFWKDANAYGEQSEKYSEYAQQVAEVNTAWAVIDGQWQDYNSQLRAYEAREAQITGLHAEQATARAAFDDQMRQCLETQAEQIEHNRQLAQGIAPLSPDDPVPTPSPDADPADDQQEADPSEPVEVVDCLETVKRPAVLDREAPPHLTAPTPPADPRPAAGNEEPARSDAPSQP